MNCNTCAWFCHADGKCYGAAYEGAAVRPNCADWTSDGLSDEERASLNALVTMEEK